MSEGIKKIDFIKNTAVFEDFKWNETVRNDDNRIEGFKKVNVFYGRNYSGKTTLSRILRGMETGAFSDRYSSPEFQLSFEDGTKVNEHTLQNHLYDIRVFNEDFVRENLRFIVDDEHSINSFAILGEDNAKIEEELQQLELEIGKEEDSNSLSGKLKKANDDFQYAGDRYQNKKSDLDSMLRKKANDPRIGIKHNKLFGDANYDITKIRNDISIVSEKEYIALTNNQIQENTDLLKEDPKPFIPKSRSASLSYGVLNSESKTLVEKQIRLSEPLQELLNDSALEVWVREGRKHHESIRTNCAFCGSVLPSDLWNKLDSHFNKESEELREGIDRLISQIDEELTVVAKLNDGSIDGFYSVFHSAFKDLDDKFDNLCKKYKASLTELRKQLEHRKKHIFNKLHFNEPESVDDTLEELIDDFEKLRNKSNQFTESLSTSQSQAHRKLRLNEVFKFVQEIDYEKVECDKQNLLEATASAKNHRDTISSKLKTKRNRISNLRAQLQDESKGADKVNYYLHKFLGHQVLRLQAVENATIEDTNKYRFEITRNGDIAYNLSEGERGLIAFCYFIAKLEDVETISTEPIIWIDDPVSSLDANHLFSVYSLINAVIVEPGQFKQVFLSTHNLEFLRFLKNLTRDNKTQFFVVERNQNNSRLVLMPDYLKNYVTEFNYLFHQIYNCATATNVDDSNYQGFFNFGNNARKFLEIYLYYKYPNGDGRNKKLKRFFGDDSIPAVLTDRINNEYSHLAGTFERGASPVEVPIPEMQYTAKLILSKLQEDRDQYDALLQSINCMDEQT